jgi:hypothetical protein
MIVMHIKNCGEQLARGLVLACAAVVLGLASGSAQANIIGIDGAGDTGQIIEPDEAVAISFQLTQSFTNVSIGAPVIPFDASGGLWLQKNAIGPTASFGDTIVAEPFNSSTGSPLVTGLTLDPALYFLIVSIDSGWATWTGSTTPVQTVGPGAALGLEFRASDLEPFVPQTDFSVLFADGALHYNVDGIATALVPAPSAIAMLALGLLSLAGRRRRGSPVS